MVLGPSHTRFPPVASTTLEEPWGYLLVDETSVVESFVLLHSEPLRDRRCSVESFGDGGHSGLFPARMRSQTRKLRGIVARGWFQMHIGRVS